MNFKLRGQMCMLESSLCKTQCQELTAITQGRDGLLLNLGGGRRDGEEEQSPEV